jgi:hypothetical protein
MNTHLNTLYAFPWITKRLPLHASLGVLHDEKSLSLPEIRSWWYSLPRGHGAE